MKKLTLLVFLGIATCAVAQKVSVDKKSEKVKGESAEGYKTTLEGKRDDVAAALGRFIKDLGKVKTTSDYQYVEGPAMGGTVYTTGVVYAITTGNEESATAWLGILSTEWTVNDITLVENQLEKLIYQFGVKFYRDKIQAQIDEAQRAMDAVTRQQQRLVNQNKDLTTKLSNNGLEKIRLEKALVLNRLDSLVLFQKIKNNTHDQDSVKKAGEQIKKVIEAHKERQRKVN